MGKYFGTDGIRGKAERFTSEFVYAIARGVANYAEELGIDTPRVLLGGDTRESTEWILRDFERAFSELGVEFGNVGVLATPGINFAFFKLGFDFAVDVTASHNPYTDNGVKIFERGEQFGVKLSEKGVEIVEKALDEMGPVEMNGGEYHESLHEAGLECYISHLEGVLSAIRPAGGEDTACDFSGLKIALDCANGATGAVSKRVFEALGADVTVINSEVAYGQGINREAGSTHIEGLAKLVREGDFDLGAAFDGDGDRCLMVDGEGTVVDGDEILVILAEWLKLPKIAVTVMANQGLFNWAKKTGVATEVTDVGDQNVFRAMREQGILLGGEQSGHVILPGEPMGDGMLTALVTTKVVAATGKTLKELAGAMTKLPQIIVNIPASTEEKEAFRAGKADEVVKEFEARLQGGRLLVRPSGTEELLRVTMWGDSEAEILALGDELGKKLKEVL